MRTIIRQSSLAVCWVRAYRGRLIAALWVLVLIGPLLASTAAVRGEGAPVGAF